MSTKIEWCEETINPVVGCSDIGAPCSRCYAKRMAWRLANMKHTRARYSGVVDRNGWTGKLNFVPSELDKPFIWRKPRRIFVCSMGDLFHEDVPFHRIDEVFSKCYSAARHTYLFLTKRPLRMAEYIKSRTGVDNVEHEIERDSKWQQSGEIEQWPPSNAHLGVSAWDQASFDRNVGILMQIPAAVRFVSLEPLLAPIMSFGYPENGEWFNCFSCGYIGRDVGPEYCEKCERFSHDDTDETCYNYHGAGLTCPDCGAHGGSSGDFGNAEYADIDMPLGQIITGAETGPGARPAKLDWFRDIRDQCVDAGVPFFFKKDSGGRTALDGREWRELPEVS